MKAAKGGAQGRLAALLIAAVTTGAATAPVCGWAKTAARPEPSAMVPSASARGPGRLRGIIVTTDVAAPRAGALGEGVNLARAHLDRRAQAAVRDALAPLIGQPLNDKMLIEVRTEIEVALARSGSRFVRAVIPVQDVTDGAIRVVLLKGRLGRLTVTGAKAFSAASYRDQIRVKPGQAIDAGRLDADIDWINRNPFRHAQIVAKAGDQTGDVDLDLEATDQPPLRVFSSFDNSGTRTTDYNHWNAGVTFGDLLNQGIQATYQHAEATDFRSFSSNSGSVTLDLPWRNLLTVSATEASLVSNLPAPLNQTGYSSQISARYQIPISNLGPLSNQMLSLGFDYKNTNNNLLFSQTPIFGDVTEIGEWSLSYSGTEADRIGATTFGGSVFYSPGHMFARDTNSAFGGQRTGAQARFAYVNLQVTRTTELPWKMSLVDSLVGQASSGNLLGTEELAMGGAGAVRGYDPDQVFADEGLISRNELRAPPMHLLTHLGSQIADQIQPFIFGDLGEGYIHSPLPGEKARLHLASSGVGLYYTLGRRFSLAFDYGWQLHDPGLGPRARTGRTDITAGLSW